MLHSSLLVFAVFCHVTGPQKAFSAHRSSAEPDISNPSHVRLLTQYCAGGKIEKNEMGRACGGYGEGEKCAQGSGGETGRKETTGETQT